MTLFLIYFLPKTLKGIKINFSTIQTILNILNKLMVKQYSRAPVWLPKLTVILQTHKVETLFSLKAGQPFKDSGKDMFWVQTNLSKDKVALSKTALDKIFEKDPYKPTPSKKDSGTKADSNSEKIEKSEGGAKDPSSSKDSEDSIFQYQKKE